MTTVQTVRGYILCIAGCPFIFSTGGTLNLSQVNTSDTLWWGQDTGVELADGWLFWPDLTLSATARPLDGDVDIDPARFRLHDAPVPVYDALTDSYIDTNLVTHLATRTEDSVVSSLLTSDLSSVDTTVDVVDGSKFAINQFAWCEQECFRVTGISSNTLTVTRGALGTKAEPHSTNNTDGLYPEVFASMPWATSRKVVLWALVDNDTVNGSGYYTDVRCEFIGYTGPAPVLHDDGLTFDLVCQPLWNRIKDAIVGDTRGVLELSGANTGYSAQLFVGGAGVSGPSTNRQRYLTFDDAAQSFVDNAVTALDGLSNVTDGSSRGSFRRDGGGCSFSFDFDTSVTVTEADNIVTGPPWTLDNGLTQVHGTHYDRGSNRHAFVFHFDRCPQVAYRFSLGGYLGTFGVRTMAPLDGVSFSTTTSTHDGRNTNYQTTLRCRLSDDWDVIFSDITSFGSSNYFTAHTTPMPRKVGLAPVDDPAGYWYLIDPPALSIVTSVHADHWLDALRYVLLPQVPQLDPEADFDWSNYDTVIRLTSGPNARRVWTIDGTRSLSKLIAEVLLLNGCSLGIRNGRLAIIPWQLPDANETPVLSITEVNQLGAFNPWSIWQEGIANTITVNSDAVNLSVENDKSIRRWGRGRAMSIELDGVEVQRLENLQPDELYRQVLSRLELWSSPVQLLHAEIPQTEGYKVDMGDLVTVDSYNAPNGSGTRGIVRGKARVLAKAPDYETGKCTLALLLFGRESNGYAPCVKALDMGGPTKTDIILDSFPVLGTDDYAGSTASGVNNAGTTGFGDSCRIRPIYRDRTTVPNDETVHINGNPYFDGTYWHLDLAYSISQDLADAIGNGEWVDFTYADFQYSRPSTLKTVTYPYVMHWGSTTKPGGVTYTRSGTRLVITDAAQTTLGSSGPNVWKPEMGIDGRRGMVFTPGYTNTLTAPRAYVGGTGNWTAGLATPTAGQANGPDGASLTADRAQVLSGQYGPYYDHGSDAVYAYSAWGRTQSGTASWQAGLEHSTTAALCIAKEVTATTTYQRLTLVSSAARYLIPVDGRNRSAGAGFAGGVVAGARDVTIDCQLLVQGFTYSPPYTDTTVGPDLMTQPGTAVIKTSGYWDMVVGSITALEAATTPTADQYLVYIDSSNHLMLRQSDRRFVLTLAGSVQVTSAPQAYAAGTELRRLKWWSLPTGCGFQINSLEYTAAAVSAISMPSTVAFFSNGTDHVFPCRVDDYLVAEDIITVTTIGPDRNYAWIGDDATGVIGGTTTPNQRIAP